MFRLARVYLGYDVPVGILYVDSLHARYQFPLCKVQAGTAADTLTLSADCVADFVVDNTVYPFPLAGTDFLTAQTGTLRLTVTAALPVGIHRYALLNQQVWPGVYGVAVYGAGRFGDAVMLSEELPLVIQVQSLPATLGILPTPPTIANTQVYNA